MTRADRDGTHLPTPGDPQTTYLSATAAWESEGGRLARAREARTEDRWDTADPASLSPSTSDVLT